MTSDDSGEDVLFLAPGAAVKRIGRALVVGATLAGLIALALRSGASHPAATPRPLPRPLPLTSNARPSPAADDEYLVEVPAQDMARALAAPRCRQRCVAYNLNAPQLHHVAVAFAGLRPLAGGLVRGPDRAVLQQSVEALAAPDALVHLEIDRARRGVATGPVERDVKGDGYETVTVTQIRSGWRFTATIVVRDTAAPVPAARAWAATAARPA